MLNKNFVVNVTGCLLLAVFIQYRKLMKFIDWFVKVVFAIIAILEDWYYKSSRIFKNPLKNGLSWHSRPYV